MTTTDEHTPADAVRALRDRGVDDADELLGHGTPDQILAACHRWDGRKNVRKGLLVKWIRERDFPDEPPPVERRAEQLRARFDEYARRYPVGTVTETHAELGARRWPDEICRCDGSLEVVDATTYPNLIVECDRCEYLTAYPVRGLHVLPDEPRIPF